MIITTGEIMTQADRADARRTPPGTGGNPVTVAASSSEGAALVVPGSTAVLSKVRVMDTRDGREGDLKAYSEGRAFAYVRDDDGYEWKAPLKSLVSVAPCQG